MLNLVFLLEAYQRTGELPQTLTMVVVFQTLYVADALWFEVGLQTCDLLTVCYL